MYISMSDSIDTSQTEIGFLCDHGHFCFYEDPAYDRACAGNRVAGIYVERDADVVFRAPKYDYDEDGDFIGGDSGYSPDDYDREVGAARESLGKLFETIAID